jgi:hypothetical protein
MILQSLAAPAGLSDFSAPQSSSSSGPHNASRLIRDSNPAPVVALGPNPRGFTLPLASALPAAKLADSPIGSRPPCSRRLWSCDS